MKLTTRMEGINEHVTFLSTDFTVFPFAMHLYMCLFKLEEFFIVLLHLLQSISRA